MRFGREDVAVEREEIFVGEEQVEVLLKSESVSTSVRVLRLSEGLP